MALPQSNQDSTRIVANGKNNYTIPLILVTSLFFLWGLANSLNGTLVKQFQTALDLQRWQANIVETAFYFGYFVMALPAGVVMRKYGYKAGILLGLILYAAGAFLFYPAAEVREYSFFLLALFMIASGIAFLETAANLYVTVLGDPAKGDFRLNFAQSFNGMSIILGPVIGGLFIFSEKEYSREALAAMPIAESEAIRAAHASSVQTPYLLVGAVVTFVAILFAITKMPELKSEKEKESSISISDLLKHKHLVLGIIAQFLNVGAQVTLWGNFVDLKLDYAPDTNLWIVEKIYQISSSMSATQMASFHASFAFILFLIGRFLGTFLMGKFKSSLILGFYAVGAVVSLIVAMVGGGITAVIAIMFVYFCQSIMFPTIFALSCKNLGEGSKLASSLIIMSIVGGAIVPPLAASLFKVNTNVALAIPLICFSYIVFYAFKGSEIKEHA
ncbi:L-fucose:H+ symporter permease [Aquirufa regiilacus]|uniref:L-fucose:H+ symporter permease n=1 Tax=Aquirufa regiilacus TaxID=3024868 RepID=A0ABU3TQQ2_9BACT|nr:MULTISPECIES: L-fucose:H+ symporter permease [unclassified Aquirufa]MDT8886886.1 L-fucose:H+ symporter permease [Aquirufa sp. LEPPI-3A]MDU0808149.1 L-fucose:H+ symporter permease [Aquirufa sp. LEOWEIH-7C]